jgi:hypothetical protein
VDALKLPALKGIRRRSLVLALHAAVAGWAGTTLLAAAASPVTVLTATQRREVASLARGEAELVAIDEVLAGLGASLTTDPKGSAVTVRRGAHELVLHHK